MKNVIPLLCVLLVALLAPCAAQSRNIVASPNAIIPAPEDTLRDQEHGNLLDKMHETPFFTDYSGSDAYRLIIESSFTGLTIVVRVEHRGDSITITSKELRAGHPPATKPATGSNTDAAYTLTTDSRTLPAGENYRMLCLLADSVAAHPTQGSLTGLDGAGWTMEINSNHRYYKAKKWSPFAGDPFKEIADLMIDLSTLPHKRSLKKL